MKEFTLLWNVCLRSLSSLGSESVVRNFCSVFPRAPLAAMDRLMRAGARFSEGRGSPVFAKRFMKGDK